MSNQQGANAFRRDINGLRAWAVIAVILFHFGIPGFDGGFVGVDVFFVISGFLMTKIIIDKLDHSSGISGFSVFYFYLGRARRIIPALIALCAFLLFVGWFILPPVDYRELGTHVISSLGFLSNIKFWKEAGYFDSASHEKWLLHTWSLAVEWQFYLILPLILKIMWKVRPGRQSAIVLITALFLVSFSLSIIFTHIQPSASFYLFPTRAWEMLAGGITYLISHRIKFPAKLGNAVELLGFGLILSSIFMFSPKTPWPGYWAMVPVMGTVLILYAAKPKSAWTGAWVAQWLGTRSYSLYLWHWPIAIALVYSELHQNLNAVAFGLVLTLALGQLSYLLIENPSRNHLQKFRSGIGVASIAVAIFSVAAPAAFVRVQGGISGRLPPQIESFFDEAMSMNPRMAECHVAGPMPVPECTYGGPLLGAIVIGDSHAASIVRAVEKSLPNKNLHVLDWTMAACPTLIGVQKIPGTASPNCGQFVSSSLVKQATFPKDVPLIIMNRTSNYAFDDRENDPRPSIYSIIP
jgi:peptidoglycan/LPS O-acetylase OafA/YrhL